MLAERDESDLVVHVHLVAKSDNLFSQSCFPLLCRMGFKLQEEHQGSCLLRLGEIFPERRNLVAVGKDARPDCLEIQLLDVFVLRAGDLRAMQDHKGVIGGKMDIQLDALDSQHLRAPEACQGVLKRARMGVITSMGHDLGLRPKHDGDSQKGHHN